MILYTCTLGDYDKVLPAPDSDWRFVLYSDRNSPGWDYLETGRLDLFSYSRTARYYKINIPKEIFSSYKYSIWMDANFEITGDLNQFIKEYHKGEISIFEHPHRFCAYQEAATCIEFDKDDPETLGRQMGYYRKLGFPENGGLPASGLMVRNHTQEVKHFCDKWWEQVRDYSKRDQVSFPFVHFLTELNVHYIPLDYQSNPYFKYHNHVKANRGQKVWN